MKGRILIVEDSYVVAYHLRTILESEGYDVLASVDSGEEALKLIQTRIPDIVLMDIMLNGRIDGVETARIIKAEFSIPVIYLTALTDRNTIERAKVTEPHGYLTKPFEDREVFTVIEMALYKHTIEKRLKQSEEKYFSTLRSISDAVIVLDTDFSITYLNPAAEELAGIKHDATGQKSFFSAMRFELADEQTTINPLQCELGTARSSAIPSKLVLVSGEGKRKYVGEGSLSALVNLKGECSGLVIILKDLTLKVENEKLLRSLEQTRIVALLEGQETERGRIARDLHDGLGQLLTAIKLNIELGLPDDRQAILRKLIEDAVQESVRISENLMPSSLRDFDLPTSLYKMCRQMDVANGTRIQFDSFGDTSCLDPGQRINLFRIAQEAINNALKHAHARTISIQLTHNDESVVLTVEDDGCGFQLSNEPRNSERFGLGNMQDRAEIMGGKCYIESDTNRGTLVIVEVPVSSRKAIV